MNHLQETRNQKPETKMCGRYTLTLPLLKIAELLDLDAPEFLLEPRYNIAPTQYLPVITNEDPRTFAMHRWGLVPFWAKDPSIGNKMINARGETIASKPSFRKAVRERRCLIPVTGFYEWKKTPTGKVPHHITHKDEPVMTFGGLWEIWEDAEGKEMRTFTIITTEPNELMAEIHNRMPVIIPRELREAWLDMARPLEEVLMMVKPLEDGYLEATPVSTLVNSPRNDGPELLNPPATLF